MEMKPIHCVVIRLAPTSAGSSTPGQAVVHADQSDSGKLVGSFLLSNLPFKMSGRGRRADGGVVDCWCIRSRPLSGW